MRPWAEMTVGILLGLGLAWLLPAQTLTNETVAPEGPTGRPHDEGRNREASTRPTPPTFAEGHRDVDTRLRASVLHAWGRPPAPPPGDRPDADALRTALEGLTEATVTEVDCTVYPCTATLFKVGEADEGLMERLVARWPAARIHGGSSGIRREGRNARGTWTTVAFLDQPVESNSAEGRFVHRLGFAAHHRRSEQHQRLLEASLEATP